MKTKKMLSILVLVLILAFAWVSYSTSMSNLVLSDQNYSYLAGMKWYRSEAGLEKGLQNASLENKPVVVYFWAIWCQYCAKFQADTLGNPQVKKILEDDYIRVAIDLDLDRDVANRYGVGYPPYTLFLDGNGKVLDRVSGAVSAETLLPVVTSVRNQVRNK